MTITTNVPIIKLTPQGLQVPTAKEVLDGVLADFDKAFGGGLNKNLETPQGQLASSLAAIIHDRNNQIAWLINNLDPDYSDGVMQDAIGKIYFIKRKGQVNSVVNCEFVGLPGTIIPKDFVVKDEANNDWVLDEEISILDSGRVIGRMTGKGIYGAKANTINVLSQSIIGLDRVNNPQDAVIGNATESRTAFAERYKKSVAINSQGMPATVYSNVASLSGVIDCYVIDNPKDEIVQVGANNTPLNRHSIYVAVVGGNEQEIAEMIWRYAGNGCDFNGNTSVTVTDERYLTPKPSYQIKFQRPDDLPIYFQIKVKRGADLNIDSLVKNTIVNTFNANRVKIGSTIYSMGYISSLIDAVGKEYLLEVKVGKSLGNYSDSIEVGIDQYPTISQENIKVIIV